MSVRDDALTRGYLRAIDRLRGRYGAAVASVWGNLPDHHEARIPEFVDNVVPITAAARRLTADVTMGYLAGITGSPVLVDVTDLTPVDVEVWRDPFISTWANLDAGAALDEAVAAGQSRAVATAGEVVHRADRDVARSVAQRNPMIVGWTWAASANACDWCLKMAAVQWGPTEEEVLSHSHGYCHCRVFPRTGYFDASNRIVEIAA